MNRAVHDEICQDNFCTLSTDLVEKQKVKKKTEAEFKIKIFPRPKNMIKRIISGKKGQMEKKTQNAFIYYKL